MAAELERLRLKVRSLLHMSAPSDALYAYYAFYHDPRRTQLYVHENAAGHADGFIAVCQTGQHLFQPTVVLRTPNSVAAVELLHLALVPGRPYYLITTPDLQGAVAEVVQMEQTQINRIYHLELFRFHSPINVLVVAERGLDDRPRFLIRSQGEIAAEAGTSWLSPHFAAVYVRTTSAAQGRGWGQSVVGACTRWVVQSGRRPLYIVGEEDEPAIALAEEIGYADTGAREFAGEGVCCLG